MAVHGSDYPRFRRSLAAGHLTAALIIARDLPHVGLGDALELCRLMAAAGDPRFARAASRWLERFSAETSAGLHQVQLAAAALGELRESPESEAAWGTLGALLRAVPT